MDSPGWVHEEEAGVGGLRSLPGIDPGANSNQPSRPTEDGGVRKNRYVSLDLDWVRG